MGHILIVEPDARLSRSYAEALTVRGHSVQMAADAQTAIHAADKKKPDIIILELALTAHSGIEFLYELRSYPEWQRIPVIILSGIMEQKATTLAGKQGGWQQLGDVQFLSKSKTTLAELSKVVSKILERNAR